VEMLGRARPSTSSSPRPRADPGDPAREQAASRGATVAIAQKSPAHACAAAAEAIIPSRPPPSAPPR
jgi:hypothetical protein